MKPEISREEWADARFASTIYSLSEAREKLHFWRNNYHYWLTHPGHGYPAAEADAREGVIKWAMVIEIYLNRHHWYSEEAA